MKKLNINNDYVIVKELFSDEEGKREYVQSMFNDVAKNYDFMNSVLSAGIHHFWKRFASDQTGLKRGQKVLDICTGTGDIAIRLSKMVKSSGRVTGIDFSREMLAIAKDRIKKEKLENIDLIFGNVEKLELPNNEFDAVTAGFGIRNVVQLGNALNEILRVLKPGGKFVCLEFSHPTWYPVRKFYDFYSFCIMPLMGKLLANDTANGYLYLPESIRLFPNQKKLKEIFEEVGFSKVKYYNLSAGIAAVHIGVK